MRRGATRRLLLWFGRHKRHLPWREPFPRDPYFVLVAEMMAQQTQVERVAPAYRRFLERFPTVAVLAAAPVDDVVHAFSGLGYYRRARQLHQAAVVIAAGGWPRTVAALRRLPGLGAYTSAAVAAFAFGGSEAPVDGNIARITARLEAEKLRLGSAALLQKARAAASSLHRQEPTPEVWEALMELGATVCTPSRPHCTVCPLSSVCAARAHGDPESYPLPRCTRPRENQFWAALWLERADGRVLLRRVNHGALLTGLWLPPFRLARDERHARTVARALAGEAGYSGRLAGAETVRHTITHRNVRVVPFVLQVAALATRDRDGGWSWQQADAPAVPTSSLLAKLARACRPVVDAQSTGCAWRREGER
jgi:A/G-specific adenine glycosylase